MNLKDSIKWKQIRINRKIIALALILTIVPITALGLIAYDQTSTAIREQLNTRLLEQVTMEEDYIDSVFVTGQENLDSTFGVVDDAFYSMGQPAIADGNLVFGEDFVVNGNYALIDQLKKNTGAEVTIFQVINNEAVRVSTTISNREGERAVGTVVSETVYDAVVNERQVYRGRADVVGSWYMSRYDPIFDNNGKVIGILFVGIPEEYYRQLIKEQMSGITFGETGYMFVMDSTGLLVIHPSIEGQRNEEDFIKEMIATKEGTIFYEWEGREKIATLSYYEDKDWIIASSAYIDEFEAPVRAIRDTLIMTIIIFVILGSLAGFLLSRSISGDIRDINSDFKKIADDAINGKINTRAETDVSVDFVDIPSGLNNILDTLSSVIEVVSKSASDVALTTEKMAASIEEVTSATSEVAMNVNDIANGSQEQSSRSDEVSRTMNDMTIAVQEIAGNAKTAAEAANSARDFIADVGKQSRDLLVKMDAIQNATNSSASVIKDLEEKSNMISEMAQLITNIADQTNLLALNAAIEAARAGEHGRGFAVVADEVRKLAETSGNAASQISDLLNEIVAGTHEAVTSMEDGTNIVTMGAEALAETVEAVQRIVEESNRVALMAGNIASAAEQQSASIEEVNVSIEEVASISQEAAASTQETSAAIEEQTASMQDISRSSEELALLVSEMNDLVARYSAK